MGLTYKMANCSLSLSQSRVIGSSLTFSQSQGAGSSLTPSQSQAVSSTFVDSHSQGPGTCSSLSLSQKVNQPTRLLSLAPLGTSTYNEIITLPQSKAGCQSHSLSLSPREPVVHSFSLSPRELVTHSLSLSPRDLIAHSLSPREPAVHSLSLRPRETVTQYQSQIGSQSTCSFVSTKLRGNAYLSAEGASRGH